MTVLSSATALAPTGVVSARLGQSPAASAVRRNPVIGLVAMGLTFLVGSLIGAAAA